MLARRAQQRMIEFADGFDYLLQRLVIGKPAANFGNPLAPYAELPRAAACIAHRQNENLVPLATGTLGAAAAVEDGALQERTAQHLAGNRQLVDEPPARSQ